MLLDNGRSSEHADASSSFQMIIKTLFIRYTRHLSMSVTTSLRFTMPSGKMSAGQPWQFP